MNKLKPFIKKIQNLIIKILKSSAMKKFLTLKYFSVFMGGLIIILILFFGIKFMTLSNTITVESKIEYKYNDFEVQEEQNRIDVLFLGIRGASDPNGGLLADTMILASFDKDTEKMSMVSIPRDIYVKMPDLNQEDCDEGRKLNTKLLSKDGRAKINEVYALGLSCKGEAGGLSLSKQVVQYISGVYVDHVAVINFTGFRQLINIFGGVQVTLNAPFSEKEQWQGEGKDENDFWIYHETEPTEDSTEDTGYWEFYIPAGTHILDGDTALYYIRSRFSSSDFDRAVRQQQVINALKNKALSLDIISDIDRPFEILDSIGRNVRTDMSTNEILDLLNLSKKYKEIVPEQEVLKIGDDENPKMLKATKNSIGSYIIVPTQGDWEEVRTHFKTMLNE